MNQGFRLLAAAGIVIALIAGAALFVINRNRQATAVATPSPGPLLDTPAPTFIPFGSATPFPLLILPSSSPTASGSPVSSPRSSATASTSPTATPTVAPVYSCQYLVAQPTSGSAPLSVKFTATGFGSTVANYEFIFGDGTPSVRQTGTTASHTYNNAGNFVAQLKVYDSQGNITADKGGDCLRSITVRAVPTPAASPQAGSTLPKTGPEDWLWLAIIPVIGAGIYLYKKYRLI